MIFFSPTFLFTLSKVNLKNPVIENECQAVQIAEKQNQLLKELAEPSFSQEL